MSTTFKFILDKRRANNHGTYPVRLRIFQGTGYKDFTPSITLPEAAWDTGRQLVVNSYPDSRSLNAIIDGYRARVQKLLHIVELEGKPDPPLTEIIRALKPQETVVIKPLRHSIIRYGLELADKLEKAGRVGNSIIYRTAVKRFLKYVKKDDFAFTELTYSVLEDWNSAMLSEGLKVNAVSNYVRTIRAIYNRAIKEKLVDQSAYPFSQFTVRNEKTISRSLSVDEMRLIATVVPDKAYLKPYRDLFLLSFCLIGINFSDLLTLTQDNIIDGRLVFHRKKTNKVYSIKIHPKANQLLLALKGKSDADFLLPFLRSGLNPIELKKSIQLIEHRESFPLNRNT